LELIIESVGGAEDPARGERPAISVIASELEGIDGDILIADIIVDQGDGASGSSIFIIVELIIFGVGQVDFGVGVML